MRKEGAAGGWHTRHDVIGPRDRLDVGESEQLGINRPGVPRPDRVNHQAHRCEVERRCDDGTAGRTGGESATGPQQFGTGGLVDSEIDSTTPHWHVGRGHDGVDLLRGDVSAIHADPQPTSASSSEASSLSSAVIASRPDKRRPGGREDIGAPSMNPHAASSKRTAANGHPGVVRSQHLDAGTAVGTPPALGEVNQIAVLGAIWTDPLRPEERTQRIR